VALQNKAKPTALLLSRQNIAYAAKCDSVAAPDASGIDSISKGAYVLSEPSDVGLKKKTQAVIIATGSEVQLALAAQKVLAERKIAVRVVSMPSTTTFDLQSTDVQSQRVAGRRAPRCGGNGLDRRLVEVRRCGRCRSWIRTANPLLLRYCSSTSASRPRTWQTPCRPH